MEKTRKSIKIKSIKSLKKKVQIKVSKKELRMRI